MTAATCRRFQSASLRAPADSRIAVGASSQSSNPLILQSPRPLPVNSPVMRIAVLPFSAHEGTPPALGRQFAAFAGDQIRAATELEVNNVSYLAQQDSEEGPRMGFVNLG